MEFLHESVLLHQAVDSLKIIPEGIYVDATAGGAGHSLEIVKKIKEGRLIAIDRDPDSIKIATQRLAGYNATVVESNYTEIKSILENLKIKKVNGIIMDLGVSSWQLDNPERGFSYHNEAPLDMRMSQTGTSAADLVNILPAEELARIFRDYGEEKFSYRIAKSIEEKRKIKPLETTLELADAIKEAVPAFARRDGHPARKCFQALRIEVNAELEGLRVGIHEAFDLLNQGGILSIITFHSLEDRIVKKEFNSLCKGCTCPQDFPVCICGKTPQGKLINKKPIIPDQEEIKRNPRSRSAKLRSIQKIV